MVFCFLLDGLDGSCYCCCETHPQPCRLLFSPSISLSPFRILWTRPKLPTTTTIDFTPQNTCCSRQTHINKQANKGGEFSWLCGHKTTLLVVLSSSFSIAHLCTPLPCHTERMTATPFAVHSVGEAWTRKIKIVSRSWPPSSCRPCAHTNSSARQIDWGGSQTHIQQHPFVVLFAATLASKFAQASVNRETSPRQRTQPECQWI